MTSSLTPNESLDLEKNAQDSTNTVLDDQNSIDNFKRNKVAHYFNRALLSLNAETGGLERIPEDKRDPKDGGLNAGSMWFSANMVNSAMTLGMLGGSVFGLSFKESLVVIIFFNILGLSSVAFFSCFGPEFGLRQMVISRFLLGNYCMRIFALLTAIACIGWSAVNVIVSATLLNMVNVPHNIPPWASCIVLVVIIIFVSLFGYRVVHIYERWSWIPTFAVFLVYIACLKKSGSFEAGSFHGGEATAAGVLSFGSTVYGFATGWTTYASDYTVFIKKDYPRWRVFVGVALGCFLPLTFTMILGAAAITTIQTNLAWAEYYESHSSGGLLYAILAVDSLGAFGQFCAVILALSTVANAVPNMYTMAFCAQAFWSQFSRVPRVVWSVVGNLLTLAISIPAFYKFETFMENFMNLIAYYLAIYQAIALSEHFIHRKGKYSNYDVEGWNDPQRFPVGYAGCLAFCFGVFGVVMGMSQTWYTGEISILINAAAPVPGADIGFELGFAFAFVVYNIARPFEKKYVGR